MANTSENQDRVKEATPPAINREIEEETWARVAAYANKGPEIISARIAELQQEWEIERYLGVNMSSLALAGLAAAAVTKNKSWNILPAVVLGFFMQHAIQGWCPPLPIMRLFKIRTSKEIEQERYALKLIRGDFDKITGDQGPELSELKRAITKS